MTVAEVYSPRRTFSALWWLYQSMTVLAGSVLIAMCAQAEIILPFSPVPITGQTFGVLVTAALLGRIRATAAMLAYLAEGISGLPVFAGGAAGAAYLLGPTGGYLMGFMPAAFLIGFLSDHSWDRNLGLTLLSMTLGSMVLLSCGVLWLGVYTGWEHVLNLGFYPFVAGDLFKIALAALLLPSLRRLIK